MEEFLKKYLKKYRDQIIPTALLGTSLFVFFRVTMPQFNNVLELRKDYNGKKEDLSFLESSLSNIRNLDENEIDEDLEIVTIALPQDKDLSLIFSSLSNAAESSNTSIESFSLEIGQVYTSDKEAANTKSPVVTNKKKSNSLASDVPTLEIIAQVNGNSQNDMLEFARQIHALLPLAEITELSMSDISGRFLIKYYYKPIDTVSIANKNVVPALKQNDLELIEQLRTSSL